MAQSSGQKYECPPCPSCEDENSVLPAVTTDGLCSTSFITESSEISYLYIADPADDFNIGSLDENGCWTTTAADWAALINNDAVSGTIRCLCGIGDQGEATANNRQRSKQKTILIDNTYTLNFDVDNNTKINYSFLQRMSCTTDVCIWFGTIGCGLYGGPKGIAATVTKATPNFQRGEGNGVLYSYSFEYRGVCPPPRQYPSPIAN